MIARKFVLGLLLAALCGAGVVSAQQAGSQRVVAKLKDIEGSVLVSQGDAMAAGVRDQDLRLGSRVITTDGARATIAYDKGCVIKLGDNKRFTVVERVACAADAPPLGKAATFAVLAATAVVNAGPTEVDGEVGVSPGKVITGFPKGKVNEGRLHEADELAEQAQEDLKKAYKNLVAQKCNVNLDGQNLGGLLLTPGVYCFPGAAMLTGELLLDAQGGGNSVFVFQVGSTLTAAPGSVVRVVNGGQPATTASQMSTKPPEKARSASDCNIYWQVGRSVVIGANAQFVGNIFSQTGISAAADATLISGRALSLDGPVTMNTNLIDAVACFPAVLWRNAAAAVATGAAAAAIIDDSRRPVSPN